MKIIVLAGGLSPEREVSLTSASLVANALMENGHEVMVLDIYFGGETKYHSQKDHYEYQYSVSKEIPNLEELKLKDAPFVSEEVIENCKKADMVFLALHGSIGENGKLQSLLDIYQIPYMGSSAIGSMLAMHKDIAKRIMQSNQIQTPNWLYIDENTKMDISKVKLPCVVKPCSCGSSIGIQIATTLEELEKAIENSRKYEKELILEEKIEGREFTVGILESQPLPVIEIKPLKGFYDYQNKYQQGQTEEICPAPISEEISEQLQSIALKVHESLHLGSYSRIDFLMDEKNNIYCLEANTLPGMTPTSLLPQAALANKISYNELCERIISPKIRR